MRGIRSQLEYSRDPMYPGLQVLALLGVEQVDASGLPLRQRRRVGQGDENPAASLIAVLLNSLVGLMSEPVRCRQTLAPNPSD